MRKKMMKNVRGIMLIEIMIVVAIIAFLAMIAIPSYLKFAARAKRSEAYLNLAALYTAEKLYMSEFGAYTNVLQGEKGLGWQPEGKTKYTYGFAGAPGTNYVAGTLKYDAGALGHSHADATTFVAVAVADIDGDGKSDLITINDKKEIAIVQDDLA